MQLAKNILNIELEHFNNYLSDSLQNDDPLLQVIMGHLLKSRGKQMRPMFALLCARLGGEINDSSYRAALVVELLHTASLIHDDIIDESMERRGLASVNALWKSKTAVFAGDILSLNALLITLANSDYNILKIYATAIGQIVDGEILQLRKSRKLNLNENIYYNIIKGKTASFFSAACAAGASSTFKDSAPVERLHLFGEKIGIAFQIKDDLFEYSNENIGKPGNNDIIDKKITLPLIYTLNNCNASLKRKLKHIINNKNKSADKINFIVENVIKCGGIKYAEEKMTNYRDAALKILYEFDDSNVRSALEDLVRYTTDRKY